MRRYALGWRLMLIAAQLGSGYLTAQVLLRMQELAVISAT